MDANTNLRPRTLVLCFDGTAGKYDADNTNVVKLFALLKKDDVEQLTFYQPGIGTWFKPGIVSPMFEWGAKILDEVVAWYLSAHVIDGYRFLMDNHRTGDKICIFGFSRGAYTARALAGFLYKVGLLPRGNLSQVSFAYKMYKRTDAEGLKLCAGFKQTYCRPITVEFMGVWDTVSSVGVLWSRALPFTDSNNAIKTFRHALSLDEHRTKFRPEYYHRTVTPPGATQLDPKLCDPKLCSSVEVSSTSSKPSTVSHSEQRQSQFEKKIRQLGFVRYNSTDQSYQLKQDLNHSDTVETGEPDIKEVWFAGCHSDIGGGAVSNDVEQSLSNITLRWMVREIVASGLGDIFESSARAKVNLEPTQTNSEMELDSTDALDPLHDELQSKVLWWLLEILPIPYSLQGMDNVWHTTYAPNLGRGRKIMDPHPSMHVTVKKRIESQLNYKPKAQWTPNSEVYVN